MKVLQVVTGFDINYPGGITNYARDLHSRLIILGVDSKVVSSNTPGTFKSNLVPDFYYPVSRWRRFSHHFNNNYEHESSLLAYIDSLNPDVIHFHTVYGLSVMMFDYLKEKGISYVVSLHDYYMVCPRIFMIADNGIPCRGVDDNACVRCLGRLERFDFLRVLKDKKNFWLPFFRDDTGLSKRRTLMYDFLKGAAKLLPVSKRVENIFNECAPLTNYQTLNIGNASADGFSPKSFVTDDLIKVVILGTFTYHKGADLVLDILTRTTNSNLAFSFYGKISDEYRLKAESVGIECKGAYSPNDLASILRDADVGVVAPIWEDNGPQVVMELINNCVPVFGTRVGGIPDFVGEGQGYLFHPDSDDEVTNAVQWLNKLDRSTVCSMVGSISRLKTLDEHALEITRVYEGVVSGDI